MIHIVSDSSTLYSPAQAAAAGFHCVPLSVCVNDETYRDYDEITPRAMADACRKGAKVSSSQPAVGKKQNYTAICWRTRMTLCWTSP